MPELRPIFDCPQFLRNRSRREAAPNLEIRRLREPLPSFLKAIRKGNSFANALAHSVVGANQNAARGSIDRGSIDRRSMDRVSAPNRGGGPTNRRRVTRSRTSPRRDAFGAYDRFGWRRLDGEKLKNQQAQC